MPLIKHHGVLFKNVDNARVNGQFIEILSTIFVAI